MFSKLPLKIKLFFNPCLKESDYLTVLIKLHDAIILPSPECFLNDF